jgi:glucan phosphoethanolaminetransferase (alkaline phosphatase superfamily)
MFSVLYELLGGKNDNPAYEQTIYPFVGLSTLIIAFIFALVFYLLLGRWKPVWDKTKHWLITIAVLSVVASLLAISQAKSATEEDTDAYMFMFSFINACYAITYFIILSFLFKRASIFAKRTPF